MSKKVEPYKGISVIYGANYSLDKGKPERRALFGISKEDERKTYVSGSYYPS